MTTADPLTTVTLTPPPLERAESEAPVAPPRTPIASLEQLLRDPGGYLDTLLRAERSEHLSDAVALPSLVRLSLGAIVVGAGLFGAVLGAFRGGRQIAFCALKLPLVLIVTLVVCTPPFLALARVSRASWSPRSIIALTLGSCARFALVLAGLAPIVWLVQGAVSYHSVILTVVVACALAGLSASTVLFAGLSRAGTTGTRVGLAFVAVFAVVGAQTSWLLRPFVVRPRTESVPFVRALEGDFAESVGMSARSAAGIYRPEAVREAVRGRTTDTRE
jgi:hypothetical protein